MVITRFPSNCFSSDFGEIIISDVRGTLQAVCSIDHNHILTETYYPDSNGQVIIRDMGDVIADYMMLGELSLSDKSYCNVLNFDVVLTNQAQTLSKDCFVYYCNVCTDLNLNASDINLFLTRYNKKKTAIHRKEFLSYLPNQQKINLSIAYILNGEQKYSVALWRDALKSVQSNSCDVSLPTIANILQSRIGIRVAEQDILFYDFESTNLSEVYSNIRFVNDKRIFLQQTHLLYRNCFGMPETITLTGLLERSVELGGTYGYMSGTYRKISTTPIPSYKVNSGYITQVEAAALEDLMISDQVYLYDDKGLLTEIVITSIEAVQKQPSNRPSNYIITYRQASKQGKKFIKNKLSLRTFDKTFDKTFD